MYTIGIPDSQYRRATQVLGPDMANPIEYETQDQGDGFYIFSFDMDADGIMNVEALSTKKGGDFASRFLNCHSALMAIDESTTIKNKEAKRTKSVLKLGKLAKYRRILTGSPVTKSQIDL